MGVSSACRLEPPAGSRDILELAPFPDLWSCGLCGVGEGAGPSPPGPWGWHSCPGLWSALFTPPPPAMSVSLPHPVGPQRLSVCPWNEGLRRYVVNTDSAMLPGPGLTPRHRLWAQEIGRLHPVLASFPQELLGPDGTGTRPIRRTQPGHGGCTTPTLSSAEDLSAAFGLADIFPELGARDRGRTQKANEHPGPAIQPLLGVSSPAAPHCRKLGRTGQLLPSGWSAPQWTAPLSAEGRPAHWRVRYPSRPRLPGVF